MEYRYSPNHNNRQITQQADTGQEVTYTYDSLNRLITAVTTDSSWGQSFTYDGFGNRTSPTVIKGMAPYGNWSYDAFNHMVGYGWDANGNMMYYPGGASPMTYDVDNRVTSAGGDQYASRAASASFGSVVADRGRAKGPVRCRSSGWNRGNPWTRGNCPDDRECDRVGAWHLALGKPHAVGSFSRICSLPFPSIL